MKITKKTLALWFCLLFSILFILPLPALLHSKQETVKADKNTFRVKLQKSGEIISVSEKDYICGVLACEMSPESNSEALKAQAVAAYTLAVKRRSESTENDYDFSDSPDNFQGYYDEVTQKEKFGEKYEEYSKKLSDIAEEVEGQILTYEDKPALTLYFDTSAGKTEDCKNVFGDSYPYLVPVQSAGDLLSPDYEKSLTFTPDEFKKLLSDCKIEFTSSPEKWFTDENYSESGTLLSVKICKNSLKGTELREYLSLPSACFDMRYDKDSEKIKINCRGSGHCVGMSQNGADFMAESGSSYDEILSWYYPSTKLQKIDSSDD